MTTDGAHAHATQAMAVESPDGVPRVNLWCRACQDFLYDEAFLWASLDTFVQRTQQHQALHQNAEEAVRCDEDGCVQTITNYDAVGQWCAEHPTARTEETP